MADFRFGFTRGFDSCAEVKAVGADYQELNLAGIYELSDEEIDALIADAQKNGYSYEAANCMIPGRYKLTVDDADYAAVDEYLDDALAKAKRLGIKVVVMGSSGARNYPEGVTYEKAFERLAFFLKNHVAPLCEKHDIVCALENLQYSESNILNHIEESLKLVEMTDSKYVRMLVDFYHFGRNKDSFDFLKKAKDYIVHIHVASVLNNREFPASNDGEDYSYIINFLREIGYDKREGRISFEAHLADGQDFIERATESLKVFKNI